MGCLSLGHEYHIAPTDSPLKSSNRLSAAYLPNRFRSNRVTISWSVLSSDVFPIQRGGPFSDAPAVPSLGE